MALVIKKGKDSQALTFGYSCLKSLGEKWQLIGVQSVIDKVIEVFSAVDPNDIGFAQVDVLVDVINAASGPDAKFEVNGDWIFENPLSIGEVTKGFIESLPKPDNEKKKIAPKK